MGSLHAKSSLEFKSGTDRVHTDKVLSSAKLCIKAVSIKKNLSFARQVEEKGYKNRPWRIPEIITLKVL